MPDINPAGNSASGVMSPRFEVLVNGTAIQGSVHCSVTSNNHYRADEWTATVIPDTATNWTLDKWFPKYDSQVAPMIEIRAWDEVAGKTGKNSWIIGRLDKKTWNPVTGLLEISGRDLTADLIEAKTFKNKSFKNHKSSDIVRSIVNAHIAAGTGITGGQITPTTEWATRYYETDHDKSVTDSFSKAATEWDLLTSLAQFEGFDVFVKGTVLYFQPPTAVTADAWVLRLDRTTNVLDMNCSDISFDHNELAKDVLVRVRSWNSRQGTGIEVTSPPNVALSSSHSSKAPTEYYFRRPNLDMAQAQKLADGLYKDLARHEMKVSAAWPYMTTLTARDMLRVTGAGDGLDATYFMEEVTRTLSFDGGYREEVKACNQQPITAENNL